MKRRIIGLIGLIVCMLIASFIWQNISGGEGLTKNLLRNGLIAMLIPGLIYCLGQLFGKDKSQAKKSS